MKFKVGDTVEIIEYYPAHRCSVSDRVKIVEINETGSQLGYKLSSGGWCMCEQLHMRLVKRGDSMDNLQKGDVVIESDGDEQTVLARLEDCVLLSIYNDSTYTADWSTIQELKNLGYKLKSDTPQELTVEEISEKLGYEVKVVKNKK